MTTNLKFQSIKMKQLETLFYIFTDVFYFYSENAVKAVYAIYNWRSNEQE